MTVEFIDKALNETFLDRRNTLSKAIHLLLSLASALIAALIPLALVQRLSPGNHICLAIAVVSLFLSLCSGIVCQIQMLNMDHNKVLQLLKIRGKLLQGQDVPGHISGGRIKPLYTCLGISVLCFVAAIASLSACVLQILFP